jgi:hypothetical protein
LAKRGQGENKDWYKVDNFFHKFLSLILLVNKNTSLITRLPGLKTVLMVLKPYFFDCHGPLAGGKDTKSVACKSVQEGGTGGNING